MRKTNLAHWCVMVCLGVSLSLGGALAYGNTKVRVGVLKFGTVNWELDTLTARGLDRLHGISVEVVPLASKNATAVALQGDAADIIVTDWIWVTRQRAAGKPYTFYPYSFAVGGLMARPDANIRSLADLQGKRLGIAGGPVDKSWLLLRAYGQQQLGVDLADTVTTSFVAPPLLNKLMLRGELDAGLNFWHYGARLKAAGMQSVVGVSEMLPALGVRQSIPLLGWVFDEAYAKENPDTVQAFLRASYATKKVLDQDDDAWAALKKRTKAKDERTLHALRDTYRAGIPRRFADAEVRAAAKAFALMAKFGGAKLSGGTNIIQAGTFWRELALPTW